MYLHCFVIFIFVLIFALSTSPALFALLIFLTFPILGFIGIKKYRKRWIIAYDIFISLMILLNIISAAVTPSAAGGAVFSIIINLIVAIFVGNF